MLETIFFTAAVLSLLVDGWLYRRHADASRPASVRRACAAALVGLVALQVGTIAWAAFGRAAS